MHAKRNKDLHLLNLFQVNRSQANDRFRYYPDYFIQFLVDIENRNKMLAKYKSIDAKQHEEGYFGWTSNCEGYYLTSDGLSVLEDLLESMPAPTNSESLYSKY